MTPSREEHYERLKEYMNPSGLKAVLKPGDVILSINYLSDECKTRGQVIEDAIVSQIRGHQRRRYPKAPRLATLVTHCVQFLHRMRVFNVTWPKAYWDTLDDLIARDEHIIVVRYRYKAWTSKDINRMIGLAYPYVGKKYDVLDLLQFPACEPFGYDGLLPQMICDIIGMGADNIFCSLGAIMQIAALCKEQNLQRPVECLLELTAPATFLCLEQSSELSEHPFKPVYEYRPEWIPEWAKRLPRVA